MYEVEYTYTDSFGLSASDKHLVVVNDGSIVETDKYLILGENVALKTSEVDNQLNNTLKVKSKAEAYVKETGVKVDSSKVSVKSINVVSTPGLYDAEIIVEQESTTKKIKVLVGDNIEEKDDYFMSANNTKITTEDALLEKDDVNKLIIRKSNALAIHKTSLEDVPVYAHHQIMSQVRTFDVKYSISKTDTNKAIDRKVEVVDDRYIDNDGDLYISANPFIITKEYAETITKDDYTALADVKVWHEKDTSSAYTSRVVSGTINPNNDKVQYITFGVNKNGSPLDKPSVKVAVLVVDKDIEIGTTHTLTGKDMTITAAEAKILMDATNDDYDHILIDGGEVISYNNRTLMRDGTPYVINRSAIDLSKDAPYKIKFGVIVNGVKLADPILEIDVNVIQSKQPTLEIKETSKLKVDQEFKAKDQFIRAYDNNTNEEIPFNKVDVVGLVNTKVEGIYKVKYTITDSANNVLSKTHVVVVSNGSIIEEDGYFIKANNVVETLDNIKGLNENELSILISPKVKAEVYEVESGNQIDPARVKVLGFDKVEERVGEYSLTVAIDNKETSKQVSLHISNGNIKEGDQYYLLTKDTVVTSKEVIDGDLESILLSRSQAKAVHKVNSSLGTVLVDASKVEVAPSNYDALYSVKEEPTLNNNANVKVIDNDVIENDGDVFISASHFTVGFDEIEDLNTELDFKTYIKYGKANAFSDYVTGPFEIKVVESTKLKPRLGVQNVTYSVVGYPKAKVTINVLVTDGHSQKGDKYTISAKEYIEITSSQALEILDGSEINDNIIFKQELANVVVYEGLVSVDKEVKLDKKTLKTSPGEYKVSFTVSDDPKATLETRVRVIDGKLPVLNVGREQKVELNSTKYNPLRDVSLIDLNGGGVLDLNMVNSLADLKTGGDIYVDKSDLDLTKVGVYTVKYTAVDVALTKAYGTQIVIVSDGSIVDTEDFYIYAENVTLDYTSDVYNKSDSQIISKIQSESKGYAISKKDFTRHNIVIPKLDNSFVRDVSINTVNVHVENNPESKTNILVAISKGNVIEGDKYTLTYHDAYFSLKELKSLSNAQIKSEVIKRSDAKAIPKYGTVLGTVTFNETIKQEAEKQEIEFVVIEEDSVKGKSFVHIKDKDIVVQKGDYVLSGNNYPIGILDIDKFNESKYIDLANAEEENIYTHVVSKPSLSKRPEKAVGDRPTTFSSRYESNLDLIVMAKVFDGNVVVKDEYYIVSKPVEMTSDTAVRVLEQLAANNETLIKELTGVKAYTLKDHQEVSASVVENSSTLKATVGNYSITFKVDKDPSVEIKTPLKVNNGHDITLDVPDYIEVELNSTTYNPLKNVKAYDNNAKEEITDILVEDQTNLKVAGVYDIKFTASDSVGNTVTKNSVVLVNDGSYSIVDDYFFSAKNFAIKAKDVEVGSVKHQQIVEKSEAYAYNYKTKVEVDTHNIIVSNDQGYSNVKADYNNVELKVKDTNAIKKIDVRVTDNDVVIGKYYIIESTSHKIGKKDAQSMTVSQMLKAMNVTVSKRFESSIIPEGHAKVDNYNSFKETPGLYPMTFSVIEEPEVKTTSTLEVINRDTVVVSGDYMIAANDFYVGLDDMKQMINEDYVSLAKAYAIKSENGVDKNVTVKLSKDLKEVVGKQNVSFEVEEKGSVKANVEATVLEGNVVDKDEYYITSQAASRPISELAKMQSGEIDIHKVMNVNVYKKGSNVPLGTQKTKTDLSQLAAVKATYDIEFYFEHDGEEVTVSSPLTLNDGEAPVIDIPKVVNIDLKNNTSYDPRKDLVVSDLEDDANGLEVKLVITGDDVVKKAITNKVVGVYTVRYTASDSDGNITKAYQTVVVNDGSISVGDNYALVAHNFKINIQNVETTNTHIVNKSNALAYKLGEANSYGSVGVDSNDYKASVGIYDIGLFVEQEPSVKKPIKAEVTKDSVVDGNQYSISAHNVFISKKEAESITSETLVKLADAEVMNRNTGVKEKAQVLEHNVYKTPGVYNVTFNAQHEVSTKVTVNVYVMDSDVVVIDKDYVLVASNFTETLDNVLKGINEEDYVNLAKARAFNKYDMNVSYEVGVDASTIPSEAGFKDMIFNVKENPSTKAKVIAEITEGGNIGDDYIIEAKDTVLTVSQADKVLKGKLSLINLANAKARHKDGTSAVVEVESHDIEAKHGTYSAVFRVKEEPETKIKVSINVNRGASPILTVPKYTEVQLNGTFDKLKNVKAIDDIDGDISHKVKVTGHTETNKVGIFRLEYSVEDSDFNTSTATSTLIVNDGSLVIKEGYILSAESFMINIDDVDTSDQAIITKSNAKAFSIDTYEFVDVIVSKKDDYKAAVGNYSIEIAVKDKPSVVKSIKANVVNGSVVEGDQYYLSANNIILGIKDASLITHDEMIKKADAKAIKKTDGLVGTVKVDSTNLIAKPGLYNVTYSVVEESALKLNRTIEVKDSDTVIETDDYVIYANDFMISEEGIKKANQEDVIKLANAKAYEKKNPSVLLDIHQVEAKKETVGTHKITFELDKDSEVKVQVTKTVYKDFTYKIESNDAEIEVGDLSRAINGGRIDQTIISITNTKGYKLNSDGSKEYLPVYILNKEEIVKAKAGSEVEVKLSLVDPTLETRDADLSERKLADTTSTVLVKKDSNNGGSNNKGGNGNGGSVRTGIESLSPLVLTFVMVLSLLLLVILKKKRIRSI